jgi:hypothetical protein
MLRVSTTDLSQFDDGKGKFFVMAKTTRRTFCKTEEAAKDHAINILEEGNAAVDEFLIVKVVGRLKLKWVKPPVDYKKVK